MLGYLRDNTGNWIIKIFLGIIVIVFVFLGVGSFTSNPNRSIATVNDEAVSVEEYQRAYTKIIEQYRARLGAAFSEEMIQMFNVRQQTLDMLIEEKLLLSEAARLDIKVSAEELQDALNATTAFQKDGLFDWERYKFVLSQNQMNPEIYEADLRNRILMQKVRNMVVGTVNISDDEARQFYLYQNTKTAVDYFGIAPERFSDIEPSAEQVTAYYEKNKQSYMSQSMLKASYISFSPSDYKDQTTVSEEKIKAFYEENTAMFSTPEMLEARHILFRLDPDAEEAKVNQVLQKAMEVYEKAAGGENFEALAKLYSEGPSKEDGGYLGKFDKTMMIKPFSDAAFALKPGEISKPVRTQYGFHIIKVTARFDAAVKTLAQASEQIKKRMIEEELQNKAYDFAGEAFDDVLDGEDFQTVAKAAGKNIKTTPAFNASGAGLKMENAPQFAKTVFELKSEDISDVVQIGDTYYLIQITERIDPQIKPFDEVEDQVKKQIKEDLQKQAAKKEAQQLLDKALDAKTLTTLTLPENAKIQSTPPFTRNGTVDQIGNATQFIEAAFTLDADNKIYPELIETSKGFFVICFKERTYPGDNEISKGLGELKNQLTWRKQNQSYQVWLDHLKKENKIEVDPSFLK